MNTMHAPQWYIGLLFGTSSPDVRGAVWSVGRLRHKYAFREYQQEARLPRDLVERVRHNKSANELPEEGLGSPKPVSGFRFSCT